MVVGSLFIVASPFSAYFIPRWLTSVFCPPKPFDLTHSVTDIEIFPCPDLLPWIILVSFAAPLLIGLAIIPWSSRQKLVEKSRGRSKKS